MTWIDRIEAMGACSDSLLWLRSLPPGTTPQQAWDACERPDWMLWVAGKTLDRSKVVLIACAVARTTLHLVPEGEDRPRIAVETAEAWARGEATIDEVMGAADAADAYDAYAAAYAAYAANAAESADAAEAAAAYATHAAEAANAANDAGSLHRARLWLCALIRSMQPDAPEVTR